MNRTVIILFLSMPITKKRATLILEDGSQFQGFSFGASTPANGEVVFSTAMTGYPESLTDPSYSGQILVMTYPIVGSYGVPDDEREDGLSKHFESDRVHVRALVVADYSDEHSHWNSARSLDQWLKEQGVPGIYGVDTRAITKLLRDHGSMLGKITVEGEPTPLGFENPNTENLVAAVSVAEPVTFGNGRHKIVVVDCGCKNNIIRHLLRRDATVTLVPWDYDFTRMDYDGAVLSNGPGNPRLPFATVDNIRKAMEIGKPIFGICMGNQLLGLAVGAETYKLRYGHRGHNQSVLLCGTDRAFITSQNHGYAVDPATLGPEWENYFVNLNDGTSEGIRHRTKPFFAVQFHPESASGPVDTEFLFDEFMDMVIASK